MRDFRAMLDLYTRATEVVWVQEEPENMGAWRTIAPHLRHIAGQSPFYAGRDEAASTAVGSKKISDLEQAQLVRKAFEM